MPCNKEESCGAKAEQQPASDTNSECNSFTDDHEQTTNRDNEEQASQQLQHLESLPQEQENQTLGPLTSDQQAAGAHHKINKPIIKMYKI